MTSLVATKLPRLLAGLAAGDCTDHAVHRSVYGPPAAGLGDGRESGRGRGGGAGALIDTLERAGLRGHGGAYFPTARKLAAVAAQRGKPVVLVTVTEGEALSHKDRLLATRLPHLLIDGALTVAGALAAERVLLAYPEDQPRVGAALSGALAGRPELDSLRAPAVVVRAVPHRYITGQETALVGALSGRGALPSFTPPYPFERGVDRAPTFVSNAETYAQIALIAGHGAGWYRALGNETAPGSRLVTVSGAVTHHRVVELAGGSGLAAALAAAGGPSEPLSALLLGGFGGTWLRLGGADGGGALDSLTLDEIALRGVGLTLGPGIVFALPASACPVAEVAAVVRYMQSQSAGQCGPCVNGLAALADDLDSLCAGGAFAGASVTRLSHWCERVQGRGACAHPDGVARFVSSALAAFPAEFAEHARAGGCERCGNQHWLVGDGGDGRGAARRSAPPDTLAGARR